jgi:hypothetical protein
MSHSGESRVTLAARRERFDTPGYVGAASIDPVSCAAAAATVFVGAATAFAAGAGLVAAAHYWGHHNGVESAVEGARIQSDSLGDLIEARMGAL